MQNKLLYGFEKSSTYWWRKNWRLLSFGSTLILIALTIALGVVLLNLVALGREGQTAHGWVLLLDLIVFVLEEFIVIHLLIALDFFESLIDVPGGIRCQICQVKSSRDQKDAFVLWGIGLLLLLHVRIWIFDVHEILKLQGLLVIIYRVHWHFVPCVIRANIAQVLRMNAGDRIKVRLFSVEFVVVVEHVFPVFARLIVHVEEVVEWILDFLFLRLTYLTGVLLFWFGRRVKNVVILTIMVVV